RHTARRHTHQSLHQTQPQPRSLTESANGVFKRETLQGRKHWSSERDARLDAFGWLHRYNTRRRHSHLGHRSPIAYEAASRTTSTTLTPAASPVSRIRGQGPRPGSQGASPNNTRVYAPVVPPSTSPS
ncbi:integrase core domain-containing protein, partial [Streptomyces sp. NPDC003480]